MNYEEDIITYIREQIMEGRSADLDVTTPLLELNIIDSISLLMLTTHISERYGIQVPAELLTPENLQNVRAIARLLQRLNPKQG